MNRVHAATPSEPVPPDADLLAYQARLVPELDYTYARLELPKDAEGYVQAFDLSQEDEIRTFFETYGLVVVRDVISEDEAARSLDELWGTVLEANGSGIDRNDPRTWAPNPENPRSGWPWGGHLGILGNTFLLNPQAFRNREHPNAHKVFSVLFGTPKLWVSVDRAGMMRPTVAVRMPDGTTMDRDDWRSKADWLHLDMNPWTRRVSTYGWGPTISLSDDRTTGSDVLKVQGILAMVDCSQHDGGLHVVPGFHKHILGWAARNKERCQASERSHDPTTVQIGADDPIREDIQKSPIRRGSLLVWDSRIPHGTFPNHSSNFRAIQYLKMGLASDRALQPAGVDIAREQLPKGFTLSPLGEKLMGYASWE